MTAATEPPRGEQTRQAILDAAQALFLENGFNGTSMRRIAQLAGGISVGGIYNHFNSKEEIFRALLESLVPYQKIAEALQGVRGTTGPELIANAIRSLIPIAVEHIDALRLIFIDLQEFQGQTSRELGERLVPYVANFIQPVLAAEGIRHDLPYPIAWRAAVHLILGYALTEMLFFDMRQRLRFQLAELAEIPPEEWVEGMIEVYLYGVAEERG